MGTDLLQHNYDVLKDNLMHYQPTVGRLITLAEMLGFSKLPGAMEGVYACEGGLVVHSVHTALVMKRLHRVMDSRCQMVTPYSAMLVGLFHDVGKCGVEGYPYFEPRGEGQWKVSRLGEKQGCVDLGLSLFERAGVPLTADEIAAIMTHNDEDESPERPLSVLLWTANQWSRIEDELRTGRDYCSSDKAMAAGEPASL